MVLGMKGVLFSAFALGAAALDLGFGSGGRTIQDFVREVGAVSSYFDVSCY